ncbi:MAG: hypothetical protein ABIO82_03285, partial [Ginsengibacter sp.]
LPATILIFWKILLFFGLPFADLLEYWQNNRPEYDCFNTSSMKDLFAINPHEVCLQNRNEGRSDLIAQYDSMKIVFLASAFIILLVIMPALSLERKRADFN